MRNLKQNLKNNIPLIYILTALDYSLFWAAVWVLFYLRFTDYAGVGLLESIMIITMVLGEIPTGAIADLLGKKYTLSLAFFFGFLGNIIMGFAGSFFILAVGVIGATIAGVLTSGTVEALIYDSLLSTKEEKKYQKILGNISSIKMISLAIASILGGFMYSIDPRLPFIMIAIVKLFALVLSFWLTEPPIDSEVFSWTNYTKQTIKGFHELFKSKTIKIQNILIIAMTMLVAMNGHMLIDTQLVAQGWSEKHLGIIISIMYFISAIFGQLTSFVNNKFGKYISIILASSVISITMILIPYLGIILGTVFIMFRNGIMEIFGNSVSVSINNTTESKYRATTLSTYSMISNIPYILGAYLIGNMMDNYSVHIVTAGIGFLLLFVSLLSGIIIISKKTFILGK